MDQGGGNVLVDLGGGYVLVDQGGGYVLVDQGNKCTIEHFFSTPPLGHTAHRLCEL